MPIRLANPPITSDVMDTRRRNRFAVLWEKWLQALTDSVSQRAQIIGTVSHRSLSDAVTLTTVRVPEPLPAGLYRVSATILPYQGLSATGRMDITVMWVTEGASWGAQLVVRVFSDGFSPGTGSVLMRLDAGSDVQYAIGHNPGTDLNPYSAHVDLVLERLQ